MNYVYLTNCTQCGRTVGALKHMIETAEEADYEEMLEHCIGLLEWSQGACYDPYCDEGQSLEDDNYVTYHKSTYLGQDCYFLQWSAIEFIWVKEDNLDEQTKRGRTRAAESAVADISGNRSARVFLA